MDYKRIYESLISSRKNRLIDDNCYYEKHHIIPRCMNGTDDKDNLITLTAREHYIAHRLLTKFVFEKQYRFRILKAFACMLIFQKDKRQAAIKITSHVYQQLKLAVIESNRLINLGKTRHDTEYIQRAALKRSSDFIIHVYHPEYGEFIGTAYDLKNEYNLTLCTNKLIKMMTGEIDSFERGWVNIKYKDVYNEHILKCKENKILKARRKDKIESNIVEFFHNDLGYFKGTNFELVDNFKEFNYNYNDFLKLSTGEKLTIKGWILFQNKDNIEQLRLERQTNAVKDTGKITGLYKHINNGKKNKRVSINKLDDYLNNGWKIGFITRNKRRSGSKMFYHKEFKSVRCYPDSDKAKELIENGYFLK